MTQSAVEVSKLKFAWNAEGGVVLDIPAFHVYQGERLFIEGKSGSGKSSLLNILGGLNTAQQGGIEVFGTDLSQLAPAARDLFRADHVGYIFQQFNLVPYLTVQENVLLATRFSKARKRKLQSKGEKEEVHRLLTALHFPADLIKSRDVSQLSVGQQQRVAAARALIGSPELLIADEPTSALDSDAREAFVKLLFEECERNGTTLVFVSHDKSLGHLFERQVSMSDLNRIAH